MKKGDLAHLAIPGGELVVRVVPRAASNNIKVENGMFKISVTDVPENGKATKSVRKLLARSLGVAPTRLELIRGATSRNKVFRISPVCD